MEEHFEPPKPSDFDDDGTQPVTSDQERQERIDYLRSINPQHKHKKRRLPTGWVVGGVVALLVLGATGYWLFGRSPAKQKPSTATTAASSQAGTAAGGAASSGNQSQAAAITTATAHYDSVNLKLGFDYPTGWQLTDTTGSGKLTVVSPTVQLTDTTGQTVAGKITLLVESNKQPLPQFDSGSAIAVLPSQKISYSNPTPTQRGDTYVSFLSYATDPNNNGLDGVFITGDAGYLANQYIPKADVVKVDPIVSLTFLKCSDAACTQTAPLAIDSASWSDTAFSGPLMTMLKSFSFE